MSRKGCRGRMGEGGAHASGVCETDPAPPQMAPPQGGVVTPARFTVDRETQGGVNSYSGEGVLLTF